jgi:hypothetical protein
MIKFNIRMIRTVTGKDRRSDNDRMIIGSSKERRIWTCSRCVEVILLWFDRIASISSSAEVEGIEENLMKAGFSPVMRRLRSLKTCWSAMVSSKI